MIEERHYYGLTYSAEYLEHHGILGQKWGRRRFQNQDGSLTPAGKERYSREDFDSDESYDHAKKAAINSGDAAQVKAWSHELTTQELNSAIDRINTLKRLESLQEHPPTGYEKAQDALEKVAKTAGTISSIAKSSATFKKSIDSIMGKEDEKKKKKKNDESDDDDNGGKNKKKKDSVLTDDDNDTIKDARQTFAKKKNDKSALKRTADTIKTAASGMRESDPLSNLASALNPTAAAQQFANNQAKKHGDTKVNNINDDLYKAMDDVFNPDTDSF